MAQSQIVANGTADSTGKVTITFPTVNINTEFTGNVSVPLSPNTAQWIVEVTGTPVSSLGGSSSYGPIQISNTDVLSLTGTGLVAGTQYQAVLIGILVYGTSPAVVPVPTTSAVDAALVGAIQTMPATATELYTGSFAGTSPIIPISPDLRTLIVSVVGVTDAATTLLVYNVLDGSAWYDQPLYLGSAPTTGTGWAVTPITGVVGAAQGVVVNFADTPLAPRLISVFGDTAIYDESIFYNGPVTAVGVTLAAAGTSTIINGPARLLNAYVRAAGTTLSALLINGVEVVGAQGATNETAIAFPENTILAAGTAVTVKQIGAGQTQATVTYCYP